MWSFSKVIFRDAKPVTVRFTLSDGPESMPFEMEVDDDETFVLNDEFEAPMEFGSYNQT